MRQRTGTIDITSTGRHRVRVTLPDGRRPTIDILDTREDAEAVLAATLENLSDLPLVGVTLAEWGDRWLTAREVGQMVADPESDRSRWKNHIANDRIAKMALRSIRRRDAKAWLARMRGKGLERQTIINTVNVLRGMLGAAFEDELVKTNVAIGLKVPKSKRTHDAWTYATPPEQVALLEACAGPERHILGVAMGSGVRAGELVALRLADVHVEGDSPHVIIRYGGAPAHPTKGGRPRRVPLFGLALAAMRAWLAALPTYATKKKRSHNPLGLAFPGPRGGFRSEEHVLRWDAWTKIRERAGITRRFRWHDLRHTCGSSLVNGWWGRAWSLVEVRDMLGHESVTTTERYAHFAASALAAAAAGTSGGSPPALPTPPNAPPQLPPAGGFPQTATNRPHTTQPRENIDMCHDFLNRWPGVRVAPGAPSDSANLARSLPLARGQFVADSRHAFPAPALTADEWAAFEAARGTS